SKPIVGSSEPYLACSKNGVTKSNSIKNTSFFMGNMLFIDSAIESNVLRFKKSIMFRNDLL
ncbi:MAG: hypothetical protein AAFQ94_23485, partial [Bacteroidota bacterium]